jgi:hypothetical protein
MEQLKPKAIFNENIITLIDGMERGWVLIDKTTKRIVAPEDGVEGIVVSKDKIHEMMVKEILKLKPSEKIEAAHYRYWIKLTKTLFRGFSKSMISKINREEKFIFRGQVDEDTLPTELRKKLGLD